MTEERSERTDRRGAEERGTGQQHDFYVWEGVWAGVAGQTDMSARLDFRDLSQTPALLQILSPRTPVASLAGRDNNCSVRKSSTHPRLTNRATFLFDFSVLRVVLREIPLLIGGARATPHHSNASATSLVRMRHMILAPHRTRQKKKKQPSAIPCITEV